MQHGRTSFGAIILLWVAGLGAGAQFAKVSLLLPELAAIYPQAGVGLGFLLSLVSVLGVVLGLAAGVMVARFGAKRLVVPALLLGGGLSLIQAAFPPFWVMLALRVIEGGAHLAIVVAGPTLIAQLSQPRHIGFTMTLWSTFFAVSFVLTARFGLPLAGLYGPAALYLVHGLGMIAMGLILHWRLPHAVVPGLAALGPRALWARHVAVYRSPSEAAPALGWLCYTLTFVALLSILPTRVPEEARSFVAQSMPLAGLVVSMSLGVWLLRYLSAVQVVMLGFGLGVWGALGFALWPDDPGVAVAVSAAMGLIQGASFAAVPQLNPDRDAQARANGAMAQMGNLGNLLGTPILLWLTARYEGAGLVGFAVVSFGAGLGVHFWLAQARRRP